MAVSSAGQVQQWLKSQPWWEAFKTNFETQRTSEFRTMTELLQKAWNEPIASAFYWDRTPEGQDFWKEIDNNFLKFYYND